VILGGNSIDATTRPREIYEELKSMIAELKMSGVERVFVSGIIERGQFPPWTGMNRQTFNKVRRAVNELLKKHLKQDYVDMGKRIRYPTHYDRDGVHPGVKEGGMIKLRSAVIASFSSTIPRSVVCRT